MPIVSLTAVRMLLHNRPGTFYAENVPAAMEADSENVDFILDFDTRR